MARLIVVLGLLWTTYAHAQDQRGGYVGVGVGQFSYEEEEDADMTRLDDAALSYKLYGGYRLSALWSFEGSYGQTTLKSSFPFEYRFRPFLGSLQGDYELIEIRVLAHLGRFLIGIGYWDAKLSAILSLAPYPTPLPPVDPPSAARVSNSDSGASIIVGGQWNLENWGIRVEYEHFDTQRGVDTHAIGLGAHFRF